MGFFVGLELPRFAIGNTENVYSS